MNRQSRLERLRRRLANRRRVVVYRLGQGMGSRSNSGLPVLLLTTTGRRSGKRRSVALSYLIDGRDYVVIASNAGRPDHPDWLLNLHVRPQATIRIGRQTIAVTGRVAAGDERGRLWARLVDIAPAFAGYQQATAREIPLVVLQPVGEPD